MSLIDEIQRGNVAAATALMDSAPQPMMLLNQRDEINGEWPLHYAVKQGLVDLASMMLDKGAKVNFSNTSGLTPLHYAARKGNVDMVSMLLSKGALLSPDTASFWTPLHYATYHGHKEVVEKLLASDPNAQLVNETDSFTRTALHVACRQGYVEIAILLLKSGAQLRKDSTGHSPLFYLSIREPTKENTLLYLDPNYAETSSNAMGADLKRLYTSGEMSDVVFEVEGLPEPNEEGIVPEGAVATTKEYKAHKAIIHARAPLLLKESLPFRKLVSDNKVAISGLTHSLFASIMEYIYCGSTSFGESDLDFVFNLAKMGRELEMPALSAFAESMILSNLSEENAVAILDAATLFGVCPHVETYCRYYILRFFDKVAQATPDEMDKFSPKQFESVLSQLPITQEPSPSLISIERPPPDFFTPRTAALPGGVRTASPLSAYAYPPAPVAMSAVASTPKASKPKKTKTKADKLDSPRGGTGGMGAGGARHGATPARTGGPSPVVPGAPPEQLQGRTLDMAKKLHKELMGEPSSPMFNSRVDHEELGLPDYPWIVKRPMDLGTAWKNLTVNRLYKTLADWAADIRLIWDNAKTYNDVVSEAHQGAERLSRHFEHGYANIQRQLEIANYDVPVPKPLEWYVQTYKKHHQEWLDANPQLLQAQPAYPPAALPPSHMPPLGTPNAMMPGAFDPNLPPAPSNPKASPGAKKSRAVPPMPSLPIAPVPPSSALAGANGANANRKRKNEQGNEEYDALHAHAAAAPPGTHYNGAPAVGMPPAAMPQYANPMGDHSVMGAMPAVPQQPPQTITQADVNRLQERLGHLNDAQAEEVVRMLNIPPNADGEFEILIEALPIETVRSLEDFLVRATGPF